MRVAVLWSGLSGYLNACLKELAGREGVELFVSHQAPERDAPFDEKQFTWIPNRLIWKSMSDLNSLAERLELFSPDIMIVAGWHIPIYRRIAKKYATRCWRVMVIDNPWSGSVRQRMGALIAPYLIRPAADVIWLPGERQSTFARKMGFEQHAVLRGSLSGDRAAFEATHVARLNNGRSLPRAFLYAGRFSPEKGVVTLANAYDKYFRETATPWPLICCGTGPLQSRLEGKSGIQIVGFVQPQHIANMMANAGCLIAPSDWDHWGVVVHEAASAGLLILASEEVGAAVHLVQPNYNGFIFGKKDAVALAELMARVSAMSDERLDEMSQASQSLSLQYSPALWADMLLDSFRALASARSVASASAQALPNFTGD